MSPNIFPTSLPPTPTPHPTHSSPLLPPPPSRGPPVRRVPQRLQLGADGALHLLVVPHLLQLPAGIMGDGIPQVPVQVVNELLQMEEDNTQDAGVEGSGGGETV